MRIPTLSLLCLIVPLSACWSTNDHLGEDLSAQAYKGREMAFHALSEVFTSEESIERSQSLAALQVEFRELALLFPFDADVKAALGALLFDGGDRFNSRSQLSEAIRLEPGHVSAATLLTRLLAEEGDLVGARAVIETARLFHPRDTELLLAYAQIASLDGDSVSALALLDQALAAGAEPWRVALDRSYVLEFAGEPKAAREEMLRAQALSPKELQTPQ